MNARMIIGAKPLLPAFGVTLACILAPQLFWKLEPATLIALTVGACCFGCTILSAMVFGLEYSQRTLPLLLSQPLSRQTIWREKQTMLGLGSVVLAAITILCIQILKHHAVDEDRDHLLYVFLGFGCLGAFCAMPYFIFISREIIIALAIYILLPLGLVLLAVLVLSLFDHWGLGGLVHHIESHAGRYQAGAGLIYCAGLYWLGRQKFLRLQVTDATAAELKLPDKLSDWLSPVWQKIMPGYSSPAKSLVRKELLVQKASYVIAGAWVLLFIGGIGLGLIRHWNAEDYKTFGAVSGFLLSMIIVLVSGIVSVADERSGGQIVLQRMLPVSSFRQWLLKLGISLGTAILLGLLLPFLLYEIGSLGGNILPAEPMAGTADPLRDIHEPVKAVFQGVGGMSGGDGLLAFYFAAFSVAFYASSISANTARALLWTIGLMIGLPTVARHAYLLGENFFVAPRLVFSNDFRGFYQWQIMLSLLFISLGLVSFSFFNARILQPSRRRVGMQIAAILLGAGLGVVLIRIGLILFL